MPRMNRAVASAVCALVTASLLHAQRGGGDWTTIGNDAQRSFWLRNDPKISVESLQTPGFTQVWKVKMKNQARQLNSITPPALIDFYISYRGFRTLGFFGGSSDNLIALDTDLSRIEWEKNLGTPAIAGSTIPCPGGMTSSVTRPTSTSYPSSGGGRGRGNPAKSGVGEPFEGAVTLKGRAAPVQFPTPSAKPQRRGTVAASPFMPTVQYVFAITSDGKMHSLYISNGEEPAPGVPFLPANANAHGLIVFEGNAYVATSGGCGGAPDGVWSLDLESKDVKNWKAEAPIAGSAGPSVVPDGPLIVTAGSQMAALDTETLVQKGTFSSGAAVFTSNPLVFDFKGKNMIAAATNDGKIHLVDAANMQAVASSAAFTNEDHPVTALASWQDAAGTRWILAPAAGAVASAAGFAGAAKNGTIVAWKVVDEGGKPVFQPGWMSRELISPMTPTIVNGVVFALSSGEFRTKDTKVTAAQRALKSSKAVLYALNGADGKELWNSGAAMGSFVHSGGLAAGGGRVYVSTADGTQYAFGFPMEH